MDDGFGHWLAGFIDGEGSFIIARAGRGLACWMTLRLRDDDRSVLDVIVERTGLGRVAAERRHNRHGRNSNPAAVWGVYSKADCVALARLLSEYPLRAKKASDFKVWRAAVAVWAEPGRERDPSRWEEMAALKWWLEASRRYGSEEALEHEFAGDPYALAALRRLRAA